MHALAIDPEAALLDYLEMFYKIKSTGIAARTLRRLGAIDFATTIAPGLRDVLLTGKVKEAVTRRESGRPVYDAVVLDAPPTGRIARFLGVTGEVGNLTRVGPIKTQSDSVMAVFRSAQTQVHLVTLLEEMPVQETVDGVAELTAEGMPVGMLLVNLVRSPLLPADDLAAAAAGTLDREQVRTEREAGRPRGRRRLPGRPARRGRRARRPGRPGDRRARGARWSRAARPWSCPS